MILTEEQKAEAIHTYILSKLTAEEAAATARVRKAREAKQKADADWADAQDACLHPLIARDIKNEGSRGGWDNEDSYWTSHTCQLCDLRWVTDQRWDRVGGRKGLPDDEEARKTYGN